MLKIAKKEQMALNANMEDSENSSSDDEIELKNIKSSLNEVEATIDLNSINKVMTKPKRKLNLSDAERERRRQSMIKTREIRMSKVEERKRLEQEYLKQKEEETHQKVIKKADKLRKQIEKEMYKKMLEEEKNKEQPKKDKKDKKDNKKEKIVYIEQPPPDSDDSDDGITTSESEEEIIYVQKVPKKTKKEKTTKPVKEEPQQLYQPQPRYPAFRIAY